MTRKIFDGVVLTVLLLHPVVGLFRMDARRWATAHDGTALGRIGDAVAVAL